MVGWKAINVPCAKYGNDAPPPAIPSILVYTAPMHPWLSYYTVHLLADFEPRILIETPGQTSHPFTDKTPTQAINRYRDRRTLHTFVRALEEERETTLHIANETPRNELQSGTLPTAASYQTKHYVHTVIEDKKQNHFLM